MQQIKALSLTPDAKEWLENSSQPRVLHVFDQACNLINERMDVLSIVTPQIGNGPFNLVVEDKYLFSEHICLESPVSASPNQLHLGDLTLNIADAQLWNPRPDWERLHGKKKNILDQLAKLRITNFQQHSGFDIPLKEYSGLLNHQGLPVAHSLISSLSITDIPTTLKLTSQLAGLGQGLTPAGDDFLMGAISAVWIIHPFEVAKKLAEEIANMAAPLTTSLSAAWLRSAGKGDAGILWHQLFDALIAGDDIQHPITNLLSVGETSGADAMAGFIGTLQTYIALLSRKETTLSGE